MSFVGLARRSTVWAGALALFALLGQGTAGAQPVCSGPIFENQCTPGGGAPRTDCHLEWVFTPATGPGNAVSANGLPKNRLVCYEGDPRCDRDANLTNSSCTMTAAPWKWTTPRPSS